MTSYPTQDATNPKILYRGLGTFWTQIFQEKATIQGLTLAQAEELIQRYYDLIESLNSLSVKDVVIYHKEKWLPIILYKSKFNQSPLKFNSDDVVWGQQPSTDMYYGDVTFQFGFPKIPSAEVYTYALDNGLKEFFTITDKVIDPSLVLINGTDVIVDDNGVLFFNKNIFELSSIPRTPVISGLGEPVVFTDLQGNQQTEEFMVLWVYHGQLDTEILYDNFGALFNLNSEDHLSFKPVITSLFSLFVDGPTIKSIKTLCASLLGIEVIKGATETIERILNTTDQTIVVTDQHVYKFDNFYNLLDNVRIGAELKAGDILVDAAAYYDNVVLPNWWDRNTISIASDTIKPYLTFSKNLFLGNYKFQLSFKSGIELVSIDLDNNLHFPVRGLDEDVALFNSSFDTAETRAALGLVNPGDVAIVNPVDFLFKNFFRDNMAMIKLKFQSTQITSAFLTSISLIVNSLPKHIYMIFDMLLDIPNEIYDSLNAATPITFASDNIQILNSDGSNSVGAIEKIAPLDYLNIDQRLFMVSKSPADPPANTIIQANASSAVINDTPYNPANMIGAVIRVGSVDSSGYATPIRAIPPGSSTATYSTLALLKFS